MSRDIRKISVGKDYPNNVIHYQKGATFNLLGTPHTITDIIEVVDTVAGVKKYDIFIKNSEDKVLWKSVEGMPVIIEYNISFE